MAVDSSANKGSCVDRGECSVGGKQRRALVAVTSGDPAGIGPEISLKACLDPRVLESSRPIIFGSPKVLSHMEDLLGLNVPLNIIGETEGWMEGKLNVFPVGDLSPSEFEMGKVSPKCGRAAYENVAAAVRLAQSRAIDAIATAPLNKEAMHLSGLTYPGHTEMLADLTRTKEYAMMLMAGSLNVIHVTTHVSMRKACDLVRRDRVLTVIRLAWDAMRRAGIESPRIAVAGLNPHAGESGIFGDEEVTEIIPAINEGRSLGFNVTGPYPGDTIFYRASKGEFDIVVAMYHDQGHIPVKLLGFESGVNVTVGLPVIRTSVDHGTAFDIAGKGIANAGSMIEAICLAASLSLNGRG